MIVQRHHLETLHNRGVLRLLDTPHLILHGARVELPATKPALLLCYLALQGDWVSRAALAAVVSADASEDVARHRVRVLLNRAKTFSWADALEVQNTRVRFTVPVDVADFRAAMGRGDWHAALEVYRKPLLADFPVFGEGLSEWVDLERERLDAAWLEAVRARAAQLVAAGEHRAASGLWRGCLERDGLDETALRGFMRAAYLSDQTDAALEVFGRFAANLRDELNLAPTAETLSLLRLIETAQPLELRTSASVSVPVSILQPPRLVGRETEAARIRRSVSNVVVITGEPGVGKTRFLRDLLGVNARVLRGMDGLAGVSYAPLLAFVRQCDAATLETLGAYREDLLRLMPDLNPNASLDAPDATSAGVRLLEAFARLLESSAAPLVLDDLQWVDAATLECLTFALSRGKLKLYCTLRREEITPALTRTLSAWRAEIIALEPLGADDTTRLVSSLIGVDATFPVFSQWLHARTGGNAFFALEVLKNLFETGRLRVVDGQWHSVLDDISRDYAEFDVPETVNDLVLRRVSRLPEHARRVAGAACVLGEGFDLAMLAVVVDLTPAETLDALEILEGAGVLLEHGFRHDLLRQSIHASLSAARRRALHARAGTLTTLEPARRAEHFLHARQPEAALPLLLEWGAALKRRGVLREAQQVLERSLGLDAGNLEAMSLLSGIAIQTGDYDAATRFSARVLTDSSADALTRARALNVQASLLYNAGRISEAAPVIEEAIRITAHLERQDADFEETAFDIFEAEGRYDDAITLLEPAIERLKRFGDSGALAMCLSSLAGIYDDTGRYEDALQLHFQALETARRCDAGYAQVNAAIQMMWGLRHAERSLEALRICEDALVLGEYSNTEYLRNALGAVLMHLGRLEESARVYEHNAFHGNVSTKTLAWGRLANLYADLGRLEDARRAATQSLQNALQTQVPFAQMRAAIAVLRFGTDDEVARIMPLVQGRRNPDIASQAEFEAALESRSRDQPSAKSVARETATL
jgi:tetratricopeptide (TPR) repeat protein/DNA-binding SARP family transcriptional activator